MHGQEIADELAKRRGDRPSPGKIYPALKGLKDGGYLHEEEKIGKTISYTLTPRGMNLLRSQEKVYRNFSWSTWLIFRPQFIEMLDYSNRENA